jgi:dihydroorotase
METIRWWKERGDVKVTAEVAPHHLFFSEDDIGDFDTNYKMNPPLRTKRDNALLLEGLKQGVFDLIATDHAPHTAFEKSQDFVSAPNGVTGLETALISLYHYYVHSNTFGWDLIVKRYSAEPRRFMGLAPVPIIEGGTAEFVLFNPKGETTFTPEYMQSRSENTPFLNQTLQGSIDLVVKDGEILLER